jgi:hypothetical protein
MIDRNKGIKIINSLSSRIKGTVSPDIVFYFRAYKIKLVLLVRPLMVFEFVYFVIC